MNAEVLDATLDADAGALVIGQGQMKGERVAPGRRPHEDNLTIPKLLFHPERLGVEGNRARLVGDEEMDMANADRSQSSSSATEPTLPKTHHARGRLRRSRHP